MTPKTKKALIATGVLLAGFGAAAFAYGKTWHRFSDNVWTGVPFGNTEAPEAGTVGFLMNSEIKGVKKGDRVEVLQDKGATNGYYDGEANVVWVGQFEGQQVISIDKTFGHSTQPEGGTLRVIAKA